MSQTSSFSSSTTQTAAAAKPRDKISQISDLITERVTSGGPLPREATPNPPSGEAPGAKPTPTAPERFSDDPHSIEHGGDRPALELDDDEVEGSSPKRQDKTLRDFAAEHGISVKALMGLIATDPGESDEPVSLGQLKDHWRETRQYQQQRDEFDDWRETSQNEITVARRQVQDVFERIANVVPPQTLARVFSDAEQEHAERITRAKAQVLEYFPEWHDATVMVRDRDRLVETLKGYGFSRTDVGRMDDARVVKFVVDAMRLKDRYDRLKNGGVRDRPKASTEAPSRKGHRPSIDERAKALAAKGDKDGAIALLVEGALRK